MKILIITNVKGDTRDLYKIEESFLENIRNAGKKLEVTSATELDKELDQKITAADIIVSTDMSVLNQSNVQNLKWLHLTSAGTNKLPDFLQNSDILVTNSSGVHPIPISEHVFGLMLMLARKIHKALRAQIVGKKWQRSYEYYRPTELFGKTVIIVGMGRIGERIAKIAQCFGMEVYGIVRDINKKRNGHIKFFGMDELKGLLKEADFVVNCLPGTEHTKSIIDLALFKKFKPESYFINIGRGTSVVEKDMVKALENGIIAGAGLDVFEVEPLPENSPLWKMENVIITPHYSGWTPRYTERVIGIFIENLKAYLTKEPMPNLVNKQLGY